jgi:hypothetical protein
MAQINDNVSGQSVNCKENGQVMSQILELKLVEYDTSECGHLFLERLNAESCHAVIQTF